MNLIKKWCISLESIRKKSPTLDPVRFADDYRIQSNSELYELHKDIDVVQCINIQRLHWFGHVVRMEEDAPVRRVFDAGICRSRRSGWPCVRLNAQIEEALSSIGVTNWRRRARSKGACKMCCSRLKWVHRVVMAN